MLSNKYIKGKAHDRHTILKTLTNREPYYVNDSIRRHGFEDNENAYYRPLLNGLCGGNYCLAIPKPAPRKLYAYRYASSLNKIDFSSSPDCCEGTHSQRCPEYDITYPDTEEQ